MKKYVKLIIIIILTIIDQVIKIIINKYYMDYQCVFIRSLLSFFPVINRKYFFVNTLLNTKIGFVVITCILILGLIFLLIIYKFLKERIIKPFFVDCGVILCTSGIICAIITVLFWDGTLDYIYLLPVNIIFDLKDIYLKGWCILLLGLFINKKYLSNVRLNDLINYLIISYQKYITKPTNHE